MVIKTSRLKNGMFFTMLFSVKIEIYFGFRRKRKRIREIQRFIDLTDSQIYSPLNNFLITVSINKNYII